MVPFPFDELSFVALLQEINDIFSSCLPVINRDIQTKFAL